ncbi:MAG: hypothetical protein JXA89_09310 [Anaerolineae bacterium]|nr:hypothetical protein [Anaerolineae bacterium]
MNTTLREQSRAVLAFGELEGQQRLLAGGKGSALARLYREGYPVPDGFVILPDGFAGDELKSGVWEQVQDNLARLRVGGDRVAFAVRSSALSEDSVQASFAGEFETVLDVHTDDMIREAIHTVRRSRHSERVRTYSQVKGMDSTHQVAVVIQKLVRTDVSGVLFTADPVSGSRARMAGNYVYGLGDALVSGEAEAYSFTLSRPKGRYDGPPRLKRFARRLFRMALRLEQTFGCPQDIEWCLAGGRLVVLQSRPITTLLAGDPATGEQNATLTGDYLWTNMILGEVFPQPLTPAAWSVWQEGFFNKLSFGRVSTMGSIAGRPYLNYSLMYAFITRFMGRSGKVMDMIGDSIGVPPDGIEIPPFEVPIRTVLLEVMPREMKNEIAKSRLKKDHDAFLSSVQASCRALQLEIARTRDKVALMPIWHRQIKPLFDDLQLLQDSLNEELQNRTGKAKRILVTLLGKDKAEQLLATVSGDSDQLASLGPLMGLQQLKRGEIDRETYLDRYGHRGPNENELAEPRPYEAPGWLDEQLALLDGSPADVASLLSKRRTEYETAWCEIERVLPARKTQALWRIINRISETNAVREWTRSELTRTIGTIRALFLRAGELTALGDDVFYLTLDEVGDLLAADGRSTAVDAIPARKKTLEAYRALPPLPVWIRGRFDPLQWASDPDRRLDVFDPTARVPSTAAVQDVVRGHPGSAGRVEGIVRRMDGPEQCAQFVPGEILVTSTTNVGWTPLFPRAAAVVTDIGAALSHAAIVAREIGIPAVVGCGNATLCLNTGDRVRVDGGRGIVEVLERA